MTTFLSIRKSADGTIDLSVDTSLFGTQSTKVDPAPKATSPKVAPTPKRVPAFIGGKPAGFLKPAVSAKAPKAKAVAPKGGKTAGESLYKAIRRLTQQGQYEEAIAMTPAKWPHVVESILAHQAKRANVLPAPVASTKVEAAAPKAPAKRTPKAKPATKAQGAKAPAKAVRTAKKAAPKPCANPAQSFPKGNVSEADLVLWWAAAMAQGHTDIVEGAKALTDQAILKAISDGDKANVSLHMKRCRNLVNLLKQG